MSSENISKFSRRNALRLAGTAGITVLATSVMALGSAEAAYAAQDNWRWCYRCEGLWFNGHKGYGACPVGGGHTSEGSGNYVLSDSGGGQPDWRWCSQCEGLWFNGHKGYGACPVGGGHTSKGSGNYILSDSGQSDWRWCSQCEGLWFNGHKGYGVCPAGGGHTSKGSGNYGLPFR